MTISVNGTTVINLLTREFTLGTATPGSPVTGMIRFNSSLSQFEVYNGTAWVSITSTASAAALWTWGDNSTGGLGTGTGTGTTSPVSVIGGFTDWVTISSGLRHTTGIRANGTAWSWGWNQYGNLGNNTSTTLSMSSPVSVIGGFTDWIQVSNGQYHSAALRADGSAWCWGRANFGALGNGVAGIVHRSSPVSVLGGFTWTNISASAYHTLAVRSNGTAWAWGLDGGYSRLGEGVGTNRSSPVSVAGGFTNWIQVSAGVRHSTGVRANGTAWAWGNNANGRLGDNSVTQRASPVSVVGGWTDWTLISAGWQNTAGLRANGTAWTWGSNQYGQLGINLSGAGTSRSSPVSIVGGFADWTQISCGDTHMVGLRSNGTAWTWGYNGFSTGRLGDGTTAQRSSPVSVVGGITDWDFISAGYATHAIRAV